MTVLHLKHPTCLPSLKLLGDFWALRVLDNLSDEPHRYSDILKNVDGINTVTLTTRLKRLEQGGLITRTEHSRADVTYELSDLGRKSLPILEAINTFSEQAKS